MKHVHWFLIPVFVLLFLSLQAQRQYSVGAGVGRVIVQPSAILADKKPGLGIQLSGERRLNQHFSAGINLTWAVLESQITIVRYNPSLPILTETTDYRLLTFRPELRWYLRESLRGLFAGVAFNQSFYLEKVENTLNESRRFKNPGWGGGLTAGYRYVWPSGLGIGAEGRYDLFKMESSTGKSQCLGANIGLSWNF